MVHQSEAQKALDLLESTESEVDNSVLQEAVENNTMLSFQPEKKAEKTYRLVPMMLVVVVIFFLSIAAVNFFRPWIFVEYYKGAKGNIHKAVRSEAIVSRGKANGLLKEFYQNGVLRRTGNFRNGRAEGIFRHYDDKGHLKSEATYQDGKLYGPTKSYYENGQLESEFNFFDNEFDGIQKVYYPSGEIWREFTYQGGTRLDKSGNPVSGMLKEYHDNGILVLEENYVAGRLQGAAQYYDREGHLANIQVFDHGIPLVFKEFYTNGQVRHEAYYSQYAISSEKEFDEKGNLIFEWKL